MKLVLDTHVALWWQLDPKRLSSSAGRAIERSEQLLISPLTFWEIVLLERADKVRFDRAVTAWIDGFVDLENVAVAEVTAAIAVDAALLPARGFHRDPADQFIYATALLGGHPLCSKDGLMSGYASRTKDVRVIW